jgi:ethanolamine ammonia-lyase small subunit
MPASVVVLTAYLPRFAVLEAKRDPVSVVHPDALTACLVAEADA